MRDFEQDIIAAATTGHPLTGAYFSWSLHRHKLFFFCPRAYFIRYYLAQGGWNQHSHELAQYAYFEKHLPDQFLWLESAMEQAVTQSVKSCGGRRHDFIQILSRHLSTAIRRLQASLENETWMQDPKLPGLLEVFHYEKDVENIPDLIESLIVRLRTACECFLRSPAAGKLHYPDWRLDEPFLQFRHGSFPVWIHGGLRYLNGNEQIMLRFSASPDVAPDDFLPEAALWQCCQSSAGFLVCPFDGTESYRTGSTGHLLLADLIDGSSAAMMSLIRPDGTVCIADFPKQADEPERCTVCRFRLTCRAIDRLQKKI